MRLESEQGCACVRHLTVSTYASQYVPETELIQHRLMVPPTAKGAHALCGCFNDCLSESSATGEGSCNRSCAAWERRALLFPSA